MSGFSAAWLALRETADVTARSAAITEFVVDALASRRALTIVDLGTGAGSNVRYLAPRFASPQRWRLIDDDAGLLDRAASAARDVQVFASDLTSLDPIWFAGADLVTASALLDLVSAEWLGRLIERCGHEHACMLAALNYDGRISCTPRDKADGLIRDLVNRHQQTDKGFGRALGPDAGRTTEAMLKAAGYEVRRASSDWVLDGLEHAELQRQLVVGWTSAVRELRPDLEAEIVGWERRRLAHIDSGASRIVVGHDDVAGVIR